MSVQISIPRRFNGPASSANGGYAAGSLARFVEGPANVRLLRPPPLDEPLTVVEEDGLLRAVQDELVVMEAREAEVDTEPRSPVSFAEAAEAVAGFPGWTFHGASSCFVCGPEREAPDGLRIFPGPVAGVVAASWVPPASVGDANGLVPDVVIWGVLDCPGAWAGRAADPEGMPYFPALGSMTAVVEEPVHVGERLIVMAWHLATDGRKLHTEAVLYSEDGSVKGRARHIEIKVPAEWAG